MEVAPGETVAGRYRLDRLLGEGGMGAVWAATHLVTQKPVALKFLKSRTEDQNTIRRFLREARAASAVRHPNVVQIHDVLEHSGQPVMVMDLLGGESLASRLARDRQIPLDEFAKIMVPIVSAIGSAHAAGIVHRDLKPDNVFLHEGPEGEIQPKVLDFGIAKLSAPEGAAAATAHLTSTGAVMGTPYYMAPEQVFGEKDLDHRADVWAMGVMSYECLAGRKPFDGDNVGQLFKAIVTGSLPPLEDVAPHLPKNVTDAIGRLLKNERSERAPDLRELYDILKPYSSVDASSFGSARAVAFSRPSDSGAELISGRTPSGTAALAPPLHKRRWLPVGVAAGLAATAIVVWSLLASRATGSAELEPSAGASVEAPPTATFSVATAAPPPAIRQPPAPSASVAPTPRAVAGTRAGRPPPEPTPSAATAPPLPASPPTRQSGTIVEQPPF